MIQDVDETLRRFLASELSEIPGCPIRKPEQITFDPPHFSEEWRDAPARVNLYLFELTENPRLREAAFQRTGRPGDSVRGVKRAPIHLDLGYLVTTYAHASPVQEHRLLSEVLTVFLRFPVIPSEFLTGEYHGECAGAIACQAAQSGTIGRHDLLLLWQALGGKHRPGLPLAVTAKCDPFENRLTQVVRRLVIGMQQNAKRGGRQLSLESGTVRLSLAGVVVHVDSEEPIEGALLTIGGRTESARSDANGFFYFTNLPEGELRLEIQKKGFGEIELPVEALNDLNWEAIEPIVVAMRPAPPNVEHREQTIPGNLNNKQGQQKRRQISPKIEIVDQAVTEVEIREPKDGI